MIVKIGGVNGSGKTSLVRALMDHWPKGKDGLNGWAPQPLIIGKPKIGEYVRPLQRGEPLATIFDEVVILGDYRNVCGGMDAITDKEDRLGLVAQYAERGYRGRKSLVVYEGLITGKTWGAMGALALDTREQVPWLFTFMDTPFSVCVSRVLGRRAAKGNATAFDPERTMRPTYKSCLRVEEVAREKGFPTHSVKYLHSPRRAAHELVTVVEKQYKRWAKGCR